MFLHRHQNSPPSQPTVVAIAPFEEEVHWHETKGGKQVKKYSKAKLGGDYVVHAGLEGGKSVNRTIDESNSTAEWVIRSTTTVCIAETARNGTCNKTQAKSSALRRISA